MGEGTEKGGWNDFFLAILTVVLFIQLSVYVCTIYALPVCVFVPCVLVYMCYIALWLSTMA